MKCLGEATDIVQRRLGDFLYFLQVGVEWRSFGRLFSQPTEKGTDRSEYLAEFVVQFARDMAECRLLRRDQFLRKLAALLRKRRQARKDFAVRADEVKTGQHDRDECCREEEIDLTLDARVDFADLSRGVLLAFVVFDQQSRDSGAQSGLSRLQRQSNLLLRFGFFSLVGEREHAVHGVPELRELMTQIVALLF